MSSDPDVIVVGAGIFGSTIARSLSRRGMTVVIYDDAREFSGSRASGCLMKPSWYARLPEGVYELALQELEEIYRLTRLQFALWPTKRLVEVDWIPRERFLSGAGLNIRPKKVIALGARWIEAEAQEGNEWVVERLEARKAVVVAAGYWCHELLGEAAARVQGKQGASVTWEGKRLSQPFIRPYAPYKQVVAFNDHEMSAAPGDERVWAGDWTAILAQRWDPARAAVTLARVAKATRLPQKLGEVVTGIRPYVKGAKPCLLEELSDGLWLATGGAKAGCIGAGWAGAVLGRRLSG